MGGNWGNHPELVRLRENVLKRKVLMEEVKHEIHLACEVIPVIRDLSPGKLVRVCSTERFGVK